LGIVIFVVFTGVLYFFKRKDLDTDAVIPCFLVAIIISLLINYFSGNQNKYTFHRRKFTREWYGFAIGAALVVSLELGFHPIMGNRLVSF
jgi:hypothetical protein